MSKTNVFFVVCILALTFRICITPTPTKCGPAPERWSKWSAPFQHQDQIFKSVYYSTQARTNLDSGLVEWRNLN